MTAEGNTPHQQEIIRGDIVKVIAPYTPEELHLCFLDAKSYLDGAVRMAASPERAERLIRRSGCAEFTDTINRLPTDPRMAIETGTGIEEIGNDMNGIYKVTTNGDWVDDGDGGLKFDASATSSDAGENSNF